MFLHNLKSTLETNKASFASYWLTHKSWSNFNLGSPDAYLVLSYLKVSYFRKVFLRSSISSKKRTKTIRILVKTNSFVRFLEEIDDPINHFEIKLPLTATVLPIAQSAHYTISENFFLPSMYLGSLKNTGCLQKIIQPLFANKVGDRPKVCELSNTILHCLHRAQILTTTRDIHIECPKQFKWTYA